MPIFASGGHFVTEAGSNRVDLLHDTEFLILFTAYSAPEVIRASTLGDIGFNVNGPTGNEASVGLLSANAAAPTNVQRMQSRSAIRVVGSTGTTLLQGHVTNATGGFELTWDVDSPGIAVGYAAMGGFDNVGYEEVSNQQTVYTPGFEINGLFNITRGVSPVDWDLTRTQHCLGIGAASATNQRGVFSMTQEHGAQPSNCNRAQATDLTYLAQFSGSGNRSRLTDLATITATQFTLSPWNNLGGVYVFPTAVFRGDHSWVGTTTQPTAPATPENPIDVTLPNPGFDPALWLFFGYGRQAPTLSTHTWAVAHFGAATPLGQSAISTIDAHNRNPTEAQSRMSGSNCIAFVSAEGDPQGAAHVADFQARTLRWTETTTTARQIIAWAIGDLANQPQPSVGVNPPWTIPAATPANSPI